MIFARVNVQVPYSAVGVYTDPFSFRLPTGIYGEKLSINCKDADCVVQVREDDGAFPQNPEITEQDAPRGFNSFVYVTLITGFRVRCATPGKTTRVSFTVYG